MGKIKGFLTDVTEILTYWDETDQSFRFPIPTLTIENK